MSTTGRGWGAASTPGSGPACASYSPGWAAAGGTARCGPSSGGAARASRRRWSSAWCARRGSRRSAGGGAGPGAATAARRRPLHPTCRCCLAGPTCSAPGAPTSCGRPASPSSGCRPARGATSARRSTASTAGRSRGRWAPGPRRRSPTRRWRPARRPWSTPTGAADGDGWLCRCASQ